MSRFRTALEDLASRGTPRGADDIFSMVTRSAEPPIYPFEVGDEGRGDEIMVTSTITERGRRPSWVAFAAAFGIVIAVGLGVAMLVRPADPGAQEAAGRADPSITAGPTLPPAGDVPMTVLAGSDLRYYTYLPDLHLAWRDIGGGGSQICWKTPAGEGCESDLFFAPDTLIVPNGSQVIVLTKALPSVGGGSPGDAVVEFSNGEVVTEAFTTPADIGIAYARVQIPEGSTVVSAVAS